MGVDKLLLILGPVFIAHLTAGP